jgi:hypothetical protein
MRTHAEIIKQGGTDAIVERAGLPVSVHTVRSWRQRGAIPGEYWKAISDAGLASLDELASAAAARLPANDDTHRQGEAA